MALTPDTPKDIAIREVSERASYLLTLGRVPVETPDGVQTTFPVTLNHERIVYQEVDGVRRKILEQVKDPNTITPSPERLQAEFGRQVTLGDGRTLTLLDLLGEIMDELIREELLRRVINRPPPSQTVPFQGHMLLDVGLSDTLSVLGLQWFKDGVPLQGRTTPSWLTEVALPEHSGSYTVQVATPLGAVTSEPAVVTVLPELKIQRQPIPAEAYDGEPAQFSVQAGGVGPFSYQWFCGDTLIQGATDSVYTTPVLHPTDSDRVYWVRVSGPGGAVDSRRVRVTVLPVPPASQP